MTRSERVALAREIASAGIGLSDHAACPCDEADNAGLEAASSGQSELAPQIDQSLTRSDACVSDVKAFLGEARAAGFGSVRVQPRWAALAVRSLGGSKTRVGSLVGYPHGTTLTPAKCAEAHTLLRVGVQDLAMVLDLGALRSNDLDAAYIDVRAVAEVALCRSVPLQVIIEAPRLTQRQILEACVIAKLAGAAATVSSGIDSDAGADPATVNLMRHAVGDDLQVVAAGAIRDAPAAMRLLEAGADRIATPHGLAILHSSSLAAQLDADPATESARP